MIDDERTRRIDPQHPVLTRPGAVGPEAPAAGASMPGRGNALTPAARLAEFEILGLIGEGGFGIVYLALDHSLQRRVAIKEYMPVTLARRGVGQLVELGSTRHAAAFEAGLRSFVNEARLLAHFDHPALVKVHRFWEANNTAYMVMPFYQGRTLSSELGSRSLPVDESWLRRLLDPLLDALALMHANQCYHRDIAPDNILILEDGRPLLLDLGAARRVIGDMTQALTVILKPGYAPIEQYVDQAGMRQGPWTDVYGLGALIYYAISGKAPAASVARVVSDSLVPARDIGEGRYSPALLDAVDRALAVNPRDRIESIAAFRDVLALPAARAPDPAKLARDSSPEPPQRASEASTSRWPAKPTAAPWRAPWRIVAGAAVVFIPVSWGLWPAAPTSDPTVPAVAAVAAVEKPSFAPASPTLGSPPVPAPIAAPDKPDFSPLWITSQVFAARSPDWSLVAEVSPATARINQDRLQIRIRSERDGFLYLFMLGSDARHWWLVFPNSRDENHRIRAGQSLLLPRQHWSMMAAGPAGITRFLALTSASPRNFERAGLRAQGEMHEFDLALAASAYRNTDKPAMIFAGEPQCAQQAQPCSAEYAAAQFEVQEINATDTPGGRPAAQVQR